MKNLSEDKKYPHASINVISISVGNGVNGVKNPILNGIQTIGNASLLRVYES